MRSILDELELFQRGRSVRDLGNGRGFRVSATAAVGDNGCNGTIILINFALRNLILIIS